MYPFMARKRVFVTHPLVYSVQNHLSNMASKPTTGLCAELLFRTQCTGRVSNSSDLSNPLIRLKLLLNLDTTLRSSLQHNALHGSELESREPGTIDILA